MIRVARQTILTLALAAGVGLAQPLVAATSEASGVQHELETTRRCDEHQQAQRCRDADGEVRFQCVARSPWAAFLHWIEGPDSEDDEVIVRVERPEPGIAAPAAVEEDDPKPPAPAAGPVSRQAATETRVVKREQRIVVAQGEIERCRLVANDQR